MSITRSQSKSETGNNINSRGNGRGNGGSRGNRGRGNRGRGNSRTRGSGRSKAPPPPSAENPPVFFPPSATRVCQSCHSILLEGINIEAVEKLVSEVSAISNKLKELTSDAEISKESILLKTATASDDLESLKNIVDLHLIEITEMLRVTKDPLPAIVTAPLNTPDFDLKEDFLDEDSIVKLRTGTEELSFAKLGHREVAYFGAHEYKYGGVVHDAAPLPEFLNEILEKLPLDPDENINSVLINKYVDGNSFIPAHHDDEPELSPWCRIYNVSIGEERVMRFSCGSVSHDYPLKSGTLNIMSRSMQNTWKHEITGDSLCQGIRYSFTFRHLDPLFKTSSTLLLSDSQCAAIQFGCESGTLGSFAPGKRIDTFTVEQLADRNVEYISSFKTVIIAVGVNNLRGKTSITDPAVICNMIKSKCREIIKANPEVKIGVSTVIPTADKELNAKVRDLNYMLWLFTLQDPARLTLLNFNFMGDRGSGLIRKVFLRDDSDLIHIGDDGTRVVGSLFKNFIREKGMFRRR